MIVISSAIGAVYNAKTRKNRLRFAEELLDLIAYIKNRIVMFRDPIDQIIEGFEGELLAASGFMRDFSDNGFSYAMNKSEIGKVVSANTLRRLNEFAKKLGKTDAETQNAYCELCLISLEEDIEKLKQELPEKTKMYSSLCIIAGLSAALLLI